MIAQGLTTPRRGATLPAGEGRAGRVAVRLVHVTLAVALLPALAAMLVVGGVGAAAVGLASLAARAAGLEGSGRPDEFEAFDEAGGG